ncbi:MAG: hypothetical protein M3N49_00155 [Candidatus Eremiobacteraeota bacterium]|nr:hypothetical protein [Candidatus Eremiobacteraeota bacterium]
MRELICAPVQLAVGERLRLGHDRRCVRRPLGLRFEELMEASLALVLSRRRVPAIRNLMPIRHES